MRPLRYSINVTLDGCCDHRAMFADEELHRHAVENLNRTKGQRISQRGWQLCGLEVFGATLRRPESSSSRLSSRRLMAFQMRATSSRVVHT
jgi:hypothetical protein